MADEQQTTFGQRLVRLREAAGLSRAELAKRVRLDASYVFRLENGGRQPSRKTVLAIGEALEAGGEALNSLLVAAGHAPISAVSTSGARGTRQAVPRLTLAEHESWLEEMGINESNINRLLQALAGMGMKRRQELARVVRSAVSLAAEVHEAPVSAAIIPAAGHSYSALATHTVQRLLIAAIREAVEARVSRIILVLAPGTAESVYLPVQEALSIIPAPPITLDYVECAETGVGEMILAAEEWIGEQTFAVLLPEYATRPRPDQAATGLARMLAAYRQMPGVNLLAVARVPKYRMYYGAASVATQPADRPALPLRQLLASSEAAEAADASAEVLGVVGRFILQPAVFQELRSLRDKERQAPLLIGALESLRQKGYNFAAFKWQSRHPDAGAMLQGVGEFLRADSE